MEKCGWALSFLQLKKIENTKLSPILIFDHFDQEMAILKNDGQISQISK